MSLVLAALGVACGDQTTEVSVDEEVAPAAGLSGAPGVMADATSTSDDGLLINTDKDDYQPGDTVHFTGSGWSANDTLDVVLTDDPQTHDPHRWTVNVDASGMFRDSTYVVDEGDLNVTFTLVATSRADGRSLTVNFTDGNPDAPTAGAQSPNPVLAGNTATYTVTVSYVGNSDQCTVVLTAAPNATPAWPTPPAGGLFSFSPSSVTGAGGNTRTSTLTVTVPAGTAANTYRFRITADQTADDADCQGNNETSADILLVVQANAAPNTPSTLAQFRSDGTTSIPTGGATNQTSVVLKGTVSDPNAGNTVKLQVEIKPVGTAFTNTATAESGLVANGGTASVTVGSLVNGTTYHWQARAVDNNGAVSAWASFGGNAETAADFSVDTDALTVTINQATGQADPTKVSPINFTAVFSKPVSNFVSSDVTVSGTANPTAATVTGGPTTYNVAVTGMANDGTVLASVAAGVASDAAGNANEHSGSADNTVTYDTKAPVVSNVAVSPNPANGATAVTLTARADDAATGGSSIVSAAYRIDGGSAIAMSASDGAFSSATENVTASISAATIAALSNGDHTVCVQSTDAATNTSLFSAVNACVTLTVDKVAPVVANVQLNPNPANGSVTVAVTASISDATTGDSDIASAEYSIDGGATHPMTTADETFNSATENVTGSIPAGTVAALSNGDHTVCVRGSDAAGNTSAFSAANACATLTVDKQPPVVSNVAASPSPTNGTINVTATATVDDAASSNSRIIAAYYSIDGGAPVAMAAADETFNEATENVTATIPAATIAALSNGTHTICVRGLDASGNMSAFSDPYACVTLVIDKDPPIVSNVAVTPSPTNGTINVTATAKVDDATTGNTKIVSAYYSIDGGAAIAMVASDGSFNAATENVTASIPAATVAALSNGDHHVCVKGTDEAGNTSSFSDAGACVTLRVDKEPPVVSNVAVSPSPTNGTINVTATATVDDAATGSSRIVSAYYQIDGGTAIAMTASDGTFNEATETVTATIPAAAVAALSNGDHQVCVKGSDEAGNSSAFSDAGACATLRVDKEPPVVTNVAVAPNPTNGTINVTATATVDDASSGNSDIVSAVYSIDGGPTHPMTASDGSFNSATEGVTATIPAATVAALSNGTHTVCVRGVDAAGNTSSFGDANACTNLIIDKEPPVVSNVAVDPNPTNGSIDVTATATVDDAATGSSRIVAAYYSIDGGSAVAMTASDGSFSSATENVKATIPASVVNGLSEGLHTVCVQGKDLAGNSSSFSAGDACTTLEIDKTPPEVTIDQKSGQADPTNASPINFKVSFTENVSDFATGDVSLSGTAGATIATVTGSGMTYYVAVSGMTGDGTVIASIAGGVTHDAAGNGNNASTSTDNTVVYDKTPPAISCGTADGAWHADNVSIGCTASDATSGLANAADAGFSLSTNVGAGVETSTALTNSRSIADNAGNSATAGPIGNNKIDRKAPVLTLTCPANPVILNDPAAVAHWTATDGGSGVTPAGDITLVTSSIGSKTATVTMQDAVGNSSTDSCGYTVAYTFAGFFAPVDRPNTMNVSKAGQAIPLKWRLTDALGRPITDVTSVTVKTVAMNCDGSGAVDPIEEYATASTSGLLYHGDGNYQYNWKTATSLAGTCKSISLVFGSGAISYVEGPRAFFSFKK
jgi:protein involved in ribonucleotide reduction